MVTATEELHEVDEEEEEEAEEGGDIIRGLN